MAKERVIRTKYGIFLGNHIDPLLLEFEWPESYLNDGESEFESRARIVNWFSTKTIGPPVATQDHEERDMTEKGYIGVYYNEDNGDKPVSAEVVSASFPGGRTDVEWMSRGVWLIYQERHKDD